MGKIQDRILLNKKREKDVEELKNKIQLKKEEIENSEEYKSLLTTQYNILEERSKKKREFRNLNTKIALKYLNCISGYGFYFRARDIKSSVKQGIKKGLGVSNISFIDEFSLKMIVQKFIDKDLLEVKDKIEILNKEIEEIEIKRKKGVKDKENLRVEIKKLINQQDQIIYKIGEKGREREKKKKEKIKETLQKIDKELPKYMEKITTEVNKRLLLDNL